MSCEDGFFYDQIYARACRKYALVKNMMTVQEHHFEPLNLPFFKLYREEPSKPNFIGNIEIRKIIFVDFTVSVFFIECFTKSFNYYYSQHLLLIIAKPCKPCQFTT